MGAVIQVLFIILIYGNLSIIDSSSPNASLVVETAYGKLQGKLWYARDSNKPVYAFLGIPYAAPPLGELRFSKPGVLKPWNGTRDATQIGNSCLQSNIPEVFVRNGVGDVASNYSEDCLYLNVYSPSLSGKQPVLFYIHGGGFIRGTGSQYDGAPYATYHNIVVVTTNYRLGPFGFLSTLDDNAPGNIGLWDQLAALKWVQQNIAQFGGDPSQVTIMGVSAGATSVLGLANSLDTAGLFQRAIPLSGGLGKQPAETTLKNTNLLASLLKCNTSTVSSTMTCLRRVKSEDILSSILQMRQTFWTPVVDNKFFAETDTNAYAPKKVNPIDMMVGMNTNEGFVFTTIISAFLANLKTEESISRYLKLYLGVDDKVAELITEFYFGKGPYPSTQYIFEKMSECIGDERFGYPSVSTTRVNTASGGSSYLHLFAYRPSYSKTPDWVEADHAENTGFVWGSMFSQIHGNVQNFTDTDRNISLISMKYFSNFVKTGNPNSEGLPTWPKYSRDRGEYMKINTKSEAQEKWNKKRIEFWSDIVPHCKMLIKQGAVDQACPLIVTTNKSPIMISSWPIIVLLNMICIIFLS